MEYLDPSNFVLSVHVHPGYFSRQRSKEEIEKDEPVPAFQKKEKILALSTHAIILPVALIYSIFLPLKLGTAWLYAGLAIFVVALVISITTLFNIASAPAEKPAARGVYKFSRHPIYFSGFLMFISVGIVCASWVFLFFAAVWIVFWQIVVPAEERLLIEKYGDSYRDYRDRTPRWIGIPKSSISS